MMIFTQYSRETHEYLRLCGNDVSRIDDAEKSLKRGDRLTYICSHHRANGGWEKGLSATSNPMPGEYLDEHADHLNVNDFYEQYGGERYNEQEKDRSAAREFYNNIRPTTTESIKQKNTVEQPKKRDSIWPSALKTSCAFLITGGI